LTNCLKGLIDLNNPNINIAAIDAAMALIALTKHDFKNDIDMLVGSVLLRYKEKRPKMQ